MPVDRGVVFQDSLSAHGRAPFQSSIGYVLQSLREALGCAGNILLGKRRGRRQHLVQLTLTHASLRVAGAYHHDFRPVARVGTELK